MKTFTQSIVQIILKKRLYRERGKGDSSSDYGEILV
jgi:hypothetical protein